MSHIEERCLKIFEKFYPIFIEESKKLNLMSFEHKYELFYKHFLDSAILLKYLEIKSDENVLDVGSGGGFPGVVLALLCSQTRFVLMDSVEKKMRAVENIAKNLNLKNVKTLLGRAESEGHKQEWREKFEVVLARGVASLPTLCEYCLPFVKPGGVFVAYKGPNYQKELELSQAALVELKAKFSNVVEFELPKNYGSRALILIEKIGSTPEKYPRRVGVPQKKPID